MKSIVRILIKCFDSIAIFFYSNKNNSEKTFYFLDKLSRSKSAEFINNHIESAILFNSINEYRNFVFSKVNNSGLLLEFGVFKGGSINYFSKLLKNNNDKRYIYGFDSFEGLSDAWNGTNLVNGSLTLNGRLPKVNANVQLIAGRIDNTYEKFLIELEPNSKCIAFMNMDFDIYSPTKFALEKSIPFLHSGSIIIFDEFLGYPGWEYHEYKAFTETIEQHFYFQFIAFCEPKLSFRRTADFVKCAVVILERKSKNESTIII